MVSDFHRNMIKGGIYLYPTSTIGPKGKLRLLYECNPLAFIAEQAGGLASTGRERILSIKPERLHQRVPFFIGSKAMIEQAELSSAVSTILKAVKTNGDEALYNYTELLDGATLTTLLVSKREIEVAKDIVGEELKSVESKLYEKDLL